MERKSSSSGALTLITQRLCLKYVNTIWSSPLGEVVRLVWHNGDNLWLMPKFSNSDSATGWLSSHTVIWYCTDQYWLHELHYRIHGPKGQETIIRKNYCGLRFS